jgi:PIN domain nuclease of toxin-antitoxin system
MPVIKAIKQHKILLDTHVLIWLVNGDSAISQMFRKEVDLVSQKSSILISPITIWEIGMLVEKGRIELEMDCHEWVERILALPGIQLAPLSPRIAIQSTRLPGNLHADPADRILIATAHIEDAVLITADKKILAYGQDRFVHVHDPS